MLNREYCFPDHGDVAWTRYALGGTLSPSLGELAYLETVNLDTNKLTGPIPSELFKAVNLSGLYLSNNILSGDIPAVRSALRVLEVSGNQLTGLPEDLVYCYQLQRLVANHNNITGLLPNSNNWTQLERLDLSVNRFYGTIPDDFGNLTALQVLYHLPATISETPIS